MRRALAGLSGTLALLLCASPAAAAPLDPDLWVSTGSFTTQGDQLLLEDSLSYASAYQVVETPAQRYRLSFELLAGLSSVIPSDPFGFPDLFAASAYTLDDPAFDLTAGAPGGIEVLQLDSSGALLVGGQLGPGTRGPGWQLLEIELDVPTSHLAVAFELFELAVVPRDSEVRIAGVDLAEIEVPEPVALALLWTVAVAAGLARRGRG